jgi:hypothetical protein
MTLPATPSLTHSTNQVDCSIFVNASTVSELMMKTIILAYLLHHSLVLIRKRLRLTPRGARLRLAKIDLHLKFPRHQARTSKIHCPSVDRLETLSKLAIFSSHLVLRPIPSVLVDHIATLRHHGSPRPWGLSKEKTAEYYVHLPISRILT